LSILTQLRSYDGFFKDILDSNSEGTKGQYASALKDFERYCSQEYSKSLEEMLDVLKAEKIQDQLLILQRWINASDSSPRTKRNRAGFVNKYLYYREIDRLNEKGISIPEELQQLFDTHCT